jgi:hypothetical protein
MAANEAMELDALSGGFLPDGARTGEPAARRLRFRRRRATHGGAAAGDPMEEMHAELVLLREENARLKAARHQLPSFGHVVGRIRSLPTGDEDAEDAGDEAAEMLAEVSVMRASLLEVCEELTRAMDLVRARLLDVGAEQRESPGEERFGEA